jgi:glycosyltransferase involved in cell wall biosynthesis
VPQLLSINNFHYRRAGSDALFLDHDRLFRSHGWRTAVFSMRHADNDASPWQDFFVDEIELARDYSAWQRLRLAGKVLYSFEARERLQRLLAQFQPDVVHVHSVYHHISPAILPLLGRLAAPVVLTAHDYKLACPAYKMFDGRQVCEDCKSGTLLPLLRKRCIHGSLSASSLVAAETALHRALGSYRRHIAKLICPSRFMRDKLIEWGWPAERLVHIRNFFDAELWQPQFEPGKYFAYFGRLAPEKGLTTLLHAAAHARVPVKIAGWGTTGPQLRRLAATLDVDVEFIDALPVSELSRLIQGSRAVVLPSEWYENASLAILEAMACGKPVIASRSGGNPEIVLEDEQGWLFDAGDSRDLARCLTAVAGMTNDRVQSCGRQAREFVAANYGSERYFAAMTRLYAQLGATCIDPGYFLEPQAEL